MTDAEYVQLLQVCFSRLGSRWQGFRRVRSVAGGVLVVGKHEPLPQDGAPFVAYDGQQSLLEKQPPPGDVYTETSVEMKKRITGHILTGPE